MFNWWFLFWWAISVVAFISFLLLSYAFRDFGFLLLLQSSFTFIGLVLATHFLTTHYNPQTNVVLVTKDEKTRKLSHWYQHINDDDTSGLDETIPVPSGFELERIWDQEWQSHRTSIALERVKQQISPKQFQIFDCYVLKEWSVEDIKRKLDYSSGQIYMAKYRVGKLLKQELEKLLEEEE